MPRQFTADEWDDYVRANFGTIPEAEAWRNANNVSVEGMPEPTYAGPLSAGGSAGTRLQAQGATTVDPEEEIDDMPQGALPGAPSFPNVGAWSGAMNALTGEEAAYGRQQETERKRLYDTARQAILERRYGPSDAERWYALSAAIGTPMIRPTFGGVMRNVSSSMADFGKAKREAEMSRADALLALEQSYAGGNQAAKAAEFKARREALAAQGPVIARATAPRVARPVGTQVINGKIVAIAQDPTTGEYSQTVLGDAPADLKPLPGRTSNKQPVFMGAKGPVDAMGNPVTQFDVRPTPVSATEQKQIFETEDTITSGLGVTRTLEDALSLNGQAYEGSLSGWRKSLGQLFSSDDPRYVATENFDNLVQGNALQSLKLTFGGNPTEGERTILMDLQAISSKPRPVRDAILRRALEAAKTRIGRETQRLERLKGGEYGTRGGSTAGAPRVIRYDKNGKRI